MESRAQVAVQRPHPAPTASYWHAIVGPSSIADHRSTPDLPKRADYVIVGSGITGSCTALGLLDKRPNASIVMLEARGACGGATGRNGGHTKAASYRAFTGNARNLGTDEALRVAHLERANIQAIHAFAASHPKIGCDSHPCRSVDILYDAVQWKASVAAVELMRSASAEAREAGKVVADVDQYELFGPEEASRRYRVEHAAELQGAIECDAGSVNAYALVLGMLEIAVGKGLNLQTHTAATSITAVPHANGHVEGGHDNWTVETEDRGSIAAREVILATNGYTAALHPRFQGVIVPLRGQITAQRPGSGLPDGGCLPTTYSLIYGTGYEYMITRPAGTKLAGDMVIGGGWGAMPDGGATQFGVSDDSVCQDDIGAYLRECTARYFGVSSWGADAPEGRVRQEWSGIMGTSADGRPYVGEMPGAERRGLWVCASFDGHGMALCCKCAEGLVTAMAGDDDERGRLDEWFPRSFWLTQDRLTHAKFRGRKGMETKPGEAVR